MPALFAAQFALSHACWLITYPVAGWLGATAGLPATFATPGLIATVAVVIATRLWPLHDPEMIKHVHETLAADHLHLVDVIWTSNDHRPAHAHTYVIDNLHPEWPRPG